ncbi:hypothetical protein N9B31_06550 [Mariniblastus sp.]|jgi:hypothetical protein|nr:hypothetical protein [bacterium]MDA7903307.1 hypothetical protein [Mariniblastus sp.]MDA7913267.1 hypothetical protein [bacterium]MDA7924794.1 hypothetical protein [Mariniblastus sp.]MDB4357166.1 hypothetical protein [Mariniblastus sp.]
MKGFTMQKCFLLLTCFFLAIACGCENGPKEDPEFKKTKATDVEAESKVGKKAGEKGQAMEAPAM